MSEAPFNYEVFHRQDWAGLTDAVVAPDISHITPQTLRTIKAFNDQISMSDVTMIYDTLVHYIQLRYEQYQRDLQERQTFLGRPVINSPFVIGIAGSVAVGKSTTARLLQLMLQVAYGEKAVALTTTDGFLMSNEALKAENLYERKGFPESYDMPALLDFMSRIKDGEESVQSPVYSHDISDILPGEYTTFLRPKIFIVEGINTLQAAPNSPVYLSDFFDFSIYVDAETELIEHWYLDRFAALLNQTAQLGDPDNFFYAWTQVPFDEAVNAAKNVWQSVNLPNLQDYILPTRERADLILHKTVGHVIDQVWLRKD
jgi:type I pantothenate kinase